MEQSIIDKAEKWLSSGIDEDSKNEIRKLLQPGNETALTDSFYKTLEFGTGGLRGIMGIGSNRMNKYTLGMATQGLATYLLKSFPDLEQIKVAIAHDSRNNSKFFAETTAAVFSANGIKVYFFEALRPTPELSFAIRQLGCQSGVVITASHNPKEYNGYKAYWDDGAQLVPPHDKNVIDEVNAISSVEEVKFDKNDGLIEVIGKDIDETYLNEIVKLSLSPGAIDNQKDLKIVFSPIHGTGITLVPPVLEKMGFTNVHVVKEQSDPDGNFPTVIYPNPEEAEAMSIAMQQAEAIDADLILATDPDSDRVGIGVKNNHGKYQLLNGNQTGSMLIYYLLKKWKENNKLNGNQYIVKTIVTTDLINAIAQHFEVDAFDTLTGFKYIAAMIKELESTKEFIGGGEESYGYLISDFVRDKDAIASCAMIAEMAAYAKDKEQSLFDFMLEMYDAFGLYKEKLISITKKGKSGAEEIQEMMLNLRNNPPKSLNGSALVKTIDYQSSVEKNLISNATNSINFPASNVLQFFTEDGCKISARPSGTEPKIKFYFSVNKSLSGIENYDQDVAELDQKIDAIIEELNLN